LGCYTASTGNLVADASDDRIAFVLNVEQHRKRTLLPDHYSETNVMHFLFSLLRIKGLYMFGALLAHPQEALHKRYLVYCVRVMSVGCTRVGAAN
jgi:hypothetical protein